MEAHLEIPGYKNHDYYSYYCHYYCDIIVTGLRACQQNDDSMKVVMAPKPTQKN